MTDKRQLYFQNRKTGEQTGHVTVTGLHESRVERILRGMLINIGKDWFVGDTADAAAGNWITDEKPPALKADLR